MKLRRYLITIRTISLIVVHLGCEYVINNDVGFKSMYKISTIPSSVFPKLEIIFQWVAVELHSSLF